MLVDSIAALYLSQVLGQVLGNLVSGFLLLIAYLILQAPQLSHAAAPFPFAIAA